MSVFVLSGDWHLRSSVPACRLDRRDFFDWQFDKVNYIIDLMKQKDAHLILAGDVFHTWNASPHLINRTIEVLRRVPSHLNIYYVYGNHDLPQHQLELLHKSALYTLHLALLPQVQGLSGTHWGQKAEPQYHGWSEGDRRILVAHLMVWDGKKRPWPGCADPSARRFLRKHRWADLIVTGHNHKSFYLRDRRGRWLVNPGSLTRQSADQIDQHCRVYLYDTELNKVEPIELPKRHQAVSRDHVDREQEREQRISAFVERLTSDGLEWDISFVNNLDRFLQKNRMPKTVKKAIMEVVDEQEEDK